MTPTPYAGVTSELGPMDGTPFVFTDVEAFHKAVTAGYGTDVATLTGGGALRKQSLEPGLLRSIQEDRHFTLFNKLAQTDAGATVDEYTVKRRIGGFPGSGFNGELDDIAESQGTYERKTLLIKFVMTMRQISQVQKSQRTVVDTLAEESRDAMLELKTAVNFASIYGDSAVVPQEFDGIIKTVEALNDPNVVIDMRGQGLSYMGNEIISLAAEVAGKSRFGTVTDLFCSHKVGSAELDQKLDPAARVALPGASTKIGTPVRGIVTSHGDIEVNRDPFLVEGEAPWSGQGADFAALITAAGLTAVTTFTAVAGNTDGSFSASQLGNYYYGVAAVSKRGQSAVFVSAQVTVGATQRVTLTITNPADANITGYILFRSRLNGTNAASDLRAFKRIPLTAGATTVYEDRNLDIPGTSHVLLLNMRPGDQAITLRRLMPLTRFELYPTSKLTIPFAYFMFCALRIGKVNQHALIKNVLPANATWRPFN